MTKKHSSIVLSERTSKLRDQLCQEANRLPEPQSQVMMARWEYGLESLEKVLDGEEFKDPNVRPLYEQLASLAAARRNCIASATGFRHALADKDLDENIAESYHHQMQHHEGWVTKHEDNIIFLCRNYLPHGSGFDDGTRFDFSRSNDPRNDGSFWLITEYHHLNEGGYYTHWSTHHIEVRPHMYFRIVLNDENINLVPDDDPEFCEDGFLEYMHESFNSSLLREENWYQILKGRED